MDPVKVLMISPYRAHPGSGNGIVTVLNANGAVVTEILPTQIPGIKNYILHGEDRLAVAQYIADALNFAAARQEAENRKEA